MSLECNHDSQKTTRRQTKASANTEGERRAKAAIVIGGSAFGLVPFSATSRICLFHWTAEEPVHDLIKLLEEDPGGIEADDIRGILHHYEVFNSHKRSLSKSWLELTLYTCQSLRPGAKFR